MIVNIAINNEQIRTMKLNKQILEEIGRQITSKGFHKTELYKVLRDELSGIGNWKAKPRGKPGVKNFKESNQWLVQEIDAHTQQGKVWLNKHRAPFTTN